MSDPKLDECIVSSATKLIPHMIAGIRDYHLVPIDPLRVPFMQINQADGPVGLKLNLTDSVHTGLGTIEFKSFKSSVSDPNHLKFEFKGFVPKYLIEGTCISGGRILVLPISGKGPCSITTISTTLVTKIQLKTVERKNHKYCEVDTVDLKTSFKGGAFHLTGLFSGNKELERTMNTFLNQNALDVLNELRPTLDLVWSELVKGMIKPIFDHVPCDQLLIE